MGVPGIRSTVYWGLFGGLLGSLFFWETTIFPMQFFFMPECPLAS